jgi:hypothetical protein
MARSSRHPGNHWGSCTLGAVWRPVDVASPDHAAPRGQHPSPPPAELAPGSRVVALGEVDEMAHPATPTGPAWRQC